MKLEFVNISYTYAGQSSYALKDIDLEFNEGERIALIGRNGSGKSTLMLLANGILKAQGGHIQLNGNDVSYSRKDLKKLRQSVGVVFQNPDEQIFSANVFQDICLGPLNFGLSENETRQQVQLVAKLCCIDTLLDRPTHALSGGEKTRVALAGILAMNPSFLFADELTASLDPWMQVQVFEIIERLILQKKTVILSTHDWHLARQWADRIIWLDAGHIFRQGDAETVLDNYSSPVALPDG